ncbi:MAG: acyl-CoA dehydratase activase [Chloroflexota bacterium]|nr:acyl-CoA dehydratase activase [Chloroflexota bacterium]
MYFAGIDIGSTMTKVVLLDGEGHTASVVKGPTGPEHRRLADEVVRAALDQARARLEQIAGVVATGYGRLNVPFADRHITEITCHAKGVASLFPGARTVIDIGGQDAKCIRLNGGRAVDFVMNDKCAAGTGRFLEVIAAALGISVEEMGDISSLSTTRVSISNVCTIFARQEVVARLSEGVPLEDVVAGLHDAVASRVASLARRLTVESEVVLTGGVAMNGGVVRAMADHLGCDLLVPEDPLTTGALGAAILAAEHVAKGEPVPAPQRSLERARFFT